MFVGTTRLHYPPKHRPASSAQTPPSESDPAERRTGDDMAEDGLSDRGVWLRYYGARALLIVPIAIAAIWAIRPFMLG
ncbi:MAG: hypothetical protein AAF565_03480 [Pseudomonadota bacterium]